MLILNIAICRAVLVAVWIAMARSCNNNKDDNNDNDDESIVTYEMRNVNVNENEVLVVENQRKEWDQVGTPLLALLYDFITDEQDTDCASRRGCLVWLITQKKSHFDKEYVHCSTRVQ